MSLRWPRIPLWLLVVFAMLNVAVAAARFMPLRRTAPNVLIITIDTWRFDSLACLGGKAQTPALDALASRGMVFERAYAQTDHTPESHLSMLSSRYVGRLHGSDYPLLSELLHDQGYQTAAVVSTCLLDQGVPQTKSSRTIEFGLGFDSFASVQGGPHPTTVSPPIWRPGAQTNEIALDTLGQLDASRQPWMLWVHYYDLHQPLALPAPWGENLHPLSFDKYLAAVSYVDSLCGQLLGDLRRRGLEDDTIVVVTGDHGEAFGEHDLVRTHCGVYDEVTHVPMIVCLPRGKRGTHVPIVVENLDIAPTVLTAAGFPVPPTMQGQDLMAQSNRAAPRLAYAQTFGDAAFMVTDGRWKFIEYAASIVVPGRWTISQANNPGQVTYRQRLANELFNLDTDPAEARNVRSRGQPQEGTLALALARQREGISKATIDPELGRRLKSLGY